MFTLSVILFIVTIIALIVSSKVDEEYKNVWRIGSSIGGLLVVVFFILSCMTTVGAGEVGVKTLFGQVDNETLNSGLHFVNPLVNIHKMDIRTQEYTMSKDHNEGKVKGDDAITSLTSDGLTLRLEITVWYKINEAEASNIYRTIGENYSEIIVRPAIRSVIRDMCVNYTAIDLYSNKRDKFMTDVKDKLTDLLNSKGLILDKILLRDVELPEKVRTAIDEKIASEQHAQQMVYVLQKETQEAERKRIEAQGIRDFQRTVSEGITPSLIQWKWIEAMEKLSASGNSKVVFMNGKDAGIMIGGSQF